MGDRQSGSGCGSGSGSGIAACVGLPHHKLIAYRLALEFVQRITRIRISNAHLRGQARKSAGSCALNTAEGAARQTLADKSRAYGIALCEACSAVEIAGALGACSASEVKAVLARIEREGTPAKAHGI